MPSKIRKKRARDRTRSERRQACAGGGLGGVVTESLRSSSSILTDVPVLTNINLDSESDELRVTPASNPSNEQLNDVDESVEQLNTFEFNEQLNDVDESVEQLNTFEFDEHRHLPRRSRRGPKRLIETIDGKSFNHARKTPRLHNRSHVPNCANPVPPPIHEQPATDDHSSRPLPDEHSLGSMNLSCSHCSALFFPSESLKGRYTKCCYNGKVALDPLAELPCQIKELFMGNTAHSRKFIRECRHYNSSLSLASMSASFRDFPSRGPPCLSINGQIYHHSIPLFSEDGAPPRFAQLFFINPAEALEFRLHHKHGLNLDPSICEEIDAYLREHNSLVSSYRLLYQYIEDITRETGSEPKNVCLSFFEGTSDHIQPSDRPLLFSNTLSVPVSNEVAAVFTHDDGLPSSSTKVFVYPRGKKPSSLSRLSSLCDPLCYTLLFPTGKERGWNFDMNKQKGITCMKFYSYRLHARLDDFNILLRAGLLSAQYIVDAYMKVEECNLSWIRRNQKQLRAETYSGIHDFLNKRAETERATLGVLRILPSSFIGSRRHMYKRYLDSMRLVQDFGCPSFFITMTCNPKWLDIINNLNYPEEDPCHRYDLITRVFAAKFHSLLHVDIVDNGLFGSCVAWNYSIEFQKRGLPHAHLLIYMSERDRLRDADRIDRFISAELPEDDPVLRDIILRNNIHGPCGDHNPSSPCMTNGECTKRFPKEFKDSTVINEHSHTEYRRRNTGSVSRRRDEIDNRWIVPYSPFLSRKYNCHINVEACTSINAVKYINKYINKQGYDMCTVKVATNEQKVLDYDEIESFLSLRYVGPAEALWRLYSFKLSDMSHSVQLLAVHLNKQNIITFVPGREQEALERFKDTTLTAWFRLNRVDDFARSFTYCKIVELYWFDDSSRTWKRRTQSLNRKNKTLARVAMVSPLDRERYSLRLLLLHVRGATCYEDLLRDWEDSERRYHTFEESARKNGLLEDTTQWSDCIEEACSVQMPVQLRSLFCSILLYNHLVPAIELWEKFKTFLSEDHIRSGIPNDMAERLALTQINNEIVSNNPNRTLASFGFDHSSFGEYVEDISCSSLSEQEMLTLEDEISSLNNDQEMAYNSVMNSVMNSVDCETSETCFFIDGPGGTGKTFLYNTIIKSLIRNQKNVCPLAYTGIAANLLRGGRTIHSTFSLSIQNIENVGVKPNSKRGKFLATVDVFVIDEATLVSSTVLHSIDRTLRDLTGSNVPFGGKVMLLGGDFRQCLPIVPNGTRNEIIAQTISSSPLWRHFTIIRLTINMRAIEGGQEFSDWLLSVGNGTYGDSLLIPSDRLCKDVDTLIYNIFGDKLSSLHSHEIAKRCILAPTNDHSTELNNYILERFRSPVKLREYLSVDSAETHDGTDVQQTFDQMFLNSVLTSGLPPHRLILKVGCPVILTRNLDIRKGLCNGTKLIITRLFRRSVEAITLTTNIPVTIPRITLTEAGRDLPFTLKRVQLPLRLAFSLTINKSQGQTFEFVGMDLRNQCFGHGQLYVALSRIRKPERYFVYTGVSSSDSNVKSTVLRNVVYTELFGHNHHADRVVEARTSISPQLSEPPNSSSGTECGS